MMLRRIPAPLPVAATQSLRQSAGSYVQRWESYVFHELSIVPPFTHGRRIGFQAEGFSGGSALHGGHTDHDVRLVALLAQLVQREAGLPQQPLHQQKPYAFRLLGILLLKIRLSECKSTGGVVCNSKVTSAQER